VFTHFQ
jgi:hypothetical protein